MPGQGLNSNRHLPIVANTFRVMGIIAGVPATIAFFILAWFWLSPHLAPPPAPVDAHIAYDIGGLIAAASRSMGSLFGVLDNFARWIAGVLAVASLCIALFAGALFFAGRGLLRHRLWARVVGALLTLGLLLVSFAAVAILDRSRAVDVAPLIAFCVYALWVLGWRF
jgi:hypothetical protein